MNQFREADLTVACRVCGAPAGADCTVKGKGSELLRGVDGAPVVHFGRRVLRLLIERRRSLLGEPS